MISDDTDEDADRFSDEELVGKMVSDKNEIAPAARKWDWDWPPRHRTEVTLPIDAATMRWYCKRPGWQREMTNVLKAWATIQTQAQSRTAAKQPGLSAEGQ